MNSSFNPVRLLGLSSTPPHSSNTPSSKLPPGWPRHLPPLCIYYSHGVGAVIHDQTGFLTSPRRFTPSNSWRADCWNWFDQLPDKYAESWEEDDLLIFPERNDFETDGHRLPSASKLLDFVSSAPIQVLSSVVAADMREPFEVHGAAFKYRDSAVASSVVVITDESGAVIARACNDWTESQHDGKSCRSEEPAGIATSSSFPGMDVHSYDTIARAAEGATGRPYGTLRRSDAFERSALENPDTWVDGWVYPWVEARDYLMFEAPET